MCIYSPFIIPINTFITILWVNVVLVFIISAFPLIYQTFKNVGKSDLLYTEVDHLKMDTVREYFSVFQLIWGSSAELSWINFCNFLFYQV